MCGWPASQFPPLLYPPRTNHKHAASINCLSDLSIKLLYRRIFFKQNFAPWRNALRYSHFVNNMAFVWRCKCSLRNTALCSHQFNGERLAPPFLRYFSSRFVLFLSMKCLLHRWNKEDKVNIEAAGWFRSFYFV